MKKILAFTYGILAYVIFLGAFLYAVGFVGQFIVPKDINTGPENTLISAFIVNLLLLSVFAIQHSLMARPAFKKWITKFISPAIERSTYVLLSSLALVLLFWQWQPMPYVIWSVGNETAVMIIRGIFALGWLIVFLSTFMINHFELFGLKQIFDNLKNRKTPSPHFQVRLFYGIVRHPIMLGFLIAFWATPMMTLGNLIFTVMTTAYILVAVKFLEERDLRKTIGKEYELYQKRVPMIIPFSNRA